MKPKLYRDGQEDEEDCSDIPSFTQGMPPVEEIDEFDDDVSHLVRPDIEWTRVEAAKRKEKKEKNLNIMPFTVYKYIN
ncbi:hypothetical protein TIFTF001_054380 [Ficus carica]|uniref:Uncharacterized protein n=1 Tax=Ficus carica TaxID=3494 RepID=A0AA88EG11_FICCA|nr:hypothetical protein TIFTF001_054380 [Ficus carica]